MKVTLQGEHDPQPTALHSPPPQTPTWTGGEVEPVDGGPATTEVQGNARPIGTLMVIALLLLAIVGMWMLVLGIQQGRA